MAKAKIEDQADIQSVTSKIHLGNPNTLVAPTRQKSGKKMILVSKIKLATGFFSFFSLFIHIPRFKLNFVLRIPLA